MLQPQTLFNSWDGQNWRQSPFVWGDSLADSKKAMISQTNSFAFTILSPTDWYVTRQVEAGVPVPSDITNWRESIRTLAKEKVDEINSCSTKDNLNTYVKGDEYLTWPDQPA
jgi:hypothetical protein